MIQNIDNATAPQLGRFFRVRITHRCPAARVSDKKTARQVDALKGTDAGVNSVSEKTLGLSETYRRIEATIREQKAWVESRTAAGAIKGERYCPEHKLLEVVEQLKLFAYEYAELGSKFRGELPMIADALEMKGVRISRDPSDYLFQLEHVVLPPDGQGIDGLAEECRAALAEGIKAVQLEVTTAMRRDLATRMHEPLTRIVDALSGGRLHDAVRDNLKTAIAEVGELSEDPVLKALAREVGDWASTMPDAADLKKPAVRALAGASAREIQTKVAQYVAGF